jgi:putative ribosome biogenesis GTPase RsgA
LSADLNNIVTLVGATGVGKSTLTSYLKDAKLTFDKYGGGKY